MHARNFLRALAGATLLVLFACAGTSDGPAAVAEAFWSAAEARDAEALEALRLPGGDTSINIAESSSEVAAWSLGDVAEEGMTEAMAGGMEDMARQMGDAMEGNSGN